MLFAVVDRSFVYFSETKNPVFSVKSNVLFPKLQNISEAKSKQLSLPNQVKRRLAMHALGE